MKGMDIRKRVAMQISSIVGINLEQIDTSKEFNLITDLEFDSIKLIELIIILENEFGIEITDEYLDLNIISDFQKLAGLIEKLSKSNTWG